MINRLMLLVIGSLLFIGCNNKQQDDACSKELKQIKTALDNAKKELNQLKQVSNYREPTPSDRKNYIKPLWVDGNRSFIENSTVYIETALPNKTYNHKKTYDISTSKNSILLYHISNGRSEPTGNECNYIYNNSFPLSSVTYYPEIKKVKKSQNRQTVLVIYNDAKRKISPEAVTHIKSFVDKFYKDSLNKKKESFCIPGLKDKNGVFIMQPDEACGGVLNDDDKK